MTSSLKERCTALFFTIFCVLLTQAQTSSSQLRIEPPNWWTGMANKDIQLMVHGADVGSFDVNINYPGVEFNGTCKLESPNYIFLDLKVTSEAEPGMVPIFFTKEDSKIEVQYELKHRKPRHNVGQGITPSDVIYLITPDRFANGDYANDSTEDTLEKVDRQNINGRHGGDIQGILDHFDYIKDLGITTLWLNPVLENNQEVYSYHGYGISDFYKVDSRFGSNEDYRTLVEKCHANGMKVIMDQVFNHCGIGHWWMEDLPSKNWLNQWDSFTRSNFTTITASDPYASPSDFKLLTKGWFDTSLPDLNLENKFVETYLIQNSIWWVEAFGIDGIRMDTYPYPDKHAMANWLKVLRKEYPEYFMVAETWTRGASDLSYWNNEMANRDGYLSRVNSISDYPLYFAIISAFGKDGNVYQLFETLAKDIVYGNPENNKVFNGNHDVDRILAQLNMDVDKVKLSMAFVLTTRGIPQIYYGDEILMKNRRPDGAVREDFPGGWKDDNRNAFAATGRTSKENEVFNFLRTIVNWRKDATNIHAGKLTHYQPHDNVYVYFRYTDDANTMIILNNSEKDYPKLNLDRYRESFEGYTSGTNIITGEQLKNLDELHLTKNTAAIIDLKK